MITIAQLLGILSEYNIIFPSAAMTLTHNLVCNIEEYILYFLNFYLFFQNRCVVLYIVCFVSFCVLFLCKCVLYYCHRVSTQLQIKNISYIISYFVLWPTNAQLLYKLSHSYTFQHYRVIFREFVINILKIRISQNTSIYCQYVSLQLVSTIYSHREANTEPY